MEKVNCPYCKGEGSVDVDYAATWDEPACSGFKKCSFCNGTGKVSENEANMVDIYPTLGDYMAEQRAAAIEFRAECKQDR